MNRKSLFGSILLSSFLYATATMAQPAIAADAVLEGKIEAQMAKMSLRDKLGQMVELDLRGIMTKDA